MIDVEAQKAQALALVLNHEGGYVNDPDDMGGETNFGITKKVALEYGYTGPMREIPMGAVHDIYLTKYWDVNRLDEICAVSPEIAFEMFDAAVNCGYGRAARWFETALNLLNKKEALYPNEPVDMVITAESIKNLKALKPEDLKLALTLLRIQRGAHYVAICVSKESQEKFLRGWLKRTFLPHST